MRSSFLAAAAILLAAQLSPGAAGEDWIITPPQTLTVTSGGGPSEYSATISPDDWHELNIPPGAYAGLRISYDWQRVYGNVQPNGTAFSFYDPSLPPLPWNRVGSYVQSSPLVTVSSSDPVHIVLDEPTFWLRSYYCVPTPYPGGQPLGARFNLWFGNSRVVWDNIQIELYEATVTQLSGDSHSDGLWYRPQVDTWSGIDSGRASVLTPYGVQQFTVDESGVYGIHTHFYPAEEYPLAGIYLFQDVFDVTGPYEHLLAANEQGDYGIGLPDIKSVYLEAGRTYFLVHADVQPGHQFTYNSWIAGPGQAHVVTTKIGDLNCDDVVNVFDIDPFVLALTDAAGYAAQFPSCDYMAADTNQDGDVNVFDIDPFVALLTGN
jgi:hypothetical protein